MIGLTRTLDIAATDDFIVKAKDINELAHSLQGHVFKISGSDIYNLNNYLLFCQLDKKEYNLVSLGDGNRYTSSFKAEDISNVLKRSNFEYVGKFANVFQKIGMKLDKNGIFIG